MSTFSPPFTPDFVDQLSASLADRVRPQVAFHVRSIPEQTLDALLRIEEMLSNLNEALAGPRGPKIEGDVADVITNISPRPTPFMAGGLINFDTTPPEEEPKATKSESGNYEDRHTPETTKIKPKKNPRSL